MKEDYFDIINLPHHVSRNHPQMPMEARAAQFAPFAALTGEEYDNDRLNRIFSELMDSLEEHPVVTVSYFKPDEHKAGGAYMTVSEKLKKIDTYEQIMKMEDGTVIPIGSIMDLQF